MIDEKALLAGQRAAMESNGCGYSWDGEHVFCDDPSLPEPYTSCQCKKDARAAITAYLSARGAEPVAWIEPSDMAALSRIKAQRGGTRIAALKAFPCKGDVPLYAHPKEAPDV